MGNDGPVKRVLANKALIEAALRRGALTPRSALTWARRGGRGEDIGVVGALTGIPFLADEHKRVKAADSNALMNKIIDLLGQAIGGGPEPDDEDEYAAIFPPRTTLIYDQNGDGSRPAPQTVPGAGMLPGYNYGTTTNVHTPYASGRYDGRPGTMGQLGDLDDDRADTLFPQAGMTGAQSAQASAIARQEAAERAASRAGALDPYSDDELLGLLFGDRP